MTVALVDCLLFDGSGGPPQEQSTVLIDGDRVVEVSRRRDFEPGVRTIDLAGKFVMPGLIDCHVHFALWTMQLLNHKEKSLTYLTAETYRDLRAALLAGCTSARDPGGLDAGFRQAIADGLALGPRIQTSVTIVSPTNGVLDSTNQLGIVHPQVPGMPAFRCSGPYEARARVREVLGSGADFIKIAVTGGVNSPRIDPSQQIFAREEIEAIVDEAHTWGARVICHALGGPAVLTAVEAGVDTIEHGIWLSEECVDAMAQRGTWYVPTFAEYRWHAEYGTPLKQQRARSNRESHLRSFQLAHSRGVKIAMGSDGGNYVHDFTLELECLADAGMTPGEALAAGTSRAAECLGTSEDVGSIRAGMKADILVIDGNPYKDIAAIRNSESLLCVLQDGKAVTDRIGFGQTS